MPRKMPIEVFFSYSHKDERLRDELEKHLSVLKRHGIIANWHDRRIDTGLEWQGEIDQHLEKANLILLLVSADFLASDYCYDVEMKRAMQRHAKNEVTVIPIIIRPCDWHETPFGKLQALPKDGKAVVTWHSHDEAFTDVVQGLRRVIPKESHSGVIDDHISTLVEEKTAPPVLHSFEAKEKYIGQIYTSYTLLPAPPQLVGRDGILRDLKKRIIKPEGFETEHTHNITVVRGVAGVGKTSLSATVGRDHEIEAVFSDVLWASLGNNPDLTSTLTEWEVTLTRQNLPIHRSVPEVSIILAGMLRTQRVLLIIDDVWLSGNAIPFIKIVGRKSAILLTTRITRVADELAPTPDDIYRLDPLSVEESIVLLKKLSSRVIDDCPDESLALVKELEGLPLALKVAAGILNQEARLCSNTQELRDCVREFVDQLRRDATLLLDSKAPIDMSDLLTQTTPTVAALLRKSTFELDPQSRERFAMLSSIAPKPATFDKEALQAVWEVHDPKPTVRNLVNHGLLEVLDSGRFQMHGLLVMHAQSLLRELTGR